MKKKILTLCLVLCLAATAIVGGTLAYFTDTESKVNTMVIGNVEIDVDEWSVVNGSYVPFTNDNEALTLYPIESAQGDELVNKAVGTWNRSSSQDDAYIRTIVLIEANDNLTNHTNEGGCCFDGIHYGYNWTTTGVAHGAKIETILEDTVTVGNEEYWVVSFVEVDEKAIPVNEYLFSLTDIWMDKNIESEDIAGWGTDGKVSVIVYSQGIQKESLTHAEAMEALGKITVDYVEDLEIKDDAKINGRNS